MPAKYLSGDLNFEILSLEPPALSSHAWYMTYFDGA